MNNSNSHEMMSPDVIQKVQSFFKENPDQYKQILKYNEKLKLEKQERERILIDPKERLILAKQNLCNKRMSKHMNGIISQKEKLKKEEDLEKKTSAEELLKIKRQKKYKKKKERKLIKIQLDKEFQVVSVGT
jgi:hypothetical protein